MVINQLLMIHYLVEEFMNIRKYYFYSFFKELMPIYPLYLLMFEQNGLSLEQISALLAIWSVPAVLLEIPTGILADHWSRRNLIALGSLLKAGGYLLWLFSQGFWLYAAGFLLWGIGGALQSGSEEALLFDSLKSEHQEDTFDKVYGRGRFLSGSSTILASLLGGYLGMRFGFATALSVSILFSLISTVIAASMKEVNLYKERLVRKDTLKQSVRFLICRKDILHFALLSLLVITTAGVLDEYDQLIAKDFGLSIVFIGGWTAIRFLLMSIGGVLAYRIRRRLEKLLHSTDRMLPIVVLCLVAAALLMTAGILRSLLFMVMYGLYYCIMAAADVIQEDYLQQKIETEGRSTVHSLIALSTNLYGMLCYGMFGLVVSHSELFTGITSVGGYIIVWTMLIGASYLVNKKKSKGETIGK
jgi:MFS family permease